MIALALMSVASLPGCSPVPVDKPADKEGTQPVRQTAEPVITHGEGSHAVDTAAPEGNSIAPITQHALPEDLPASNVAGDPQPFPPAVTAFMVDRDGCDHFRGEEPYDEDRRVFLEENIRQLCSGTDARLAALRQRFAENPDVTAALKPYEDQIESGESP